MAPKNALMVRFDPGARTAWHTHPFGQTLFVMSGMGLICRRGESPQTIRPGDTVFFEPDEEHWHGAAPDTGLVHLAMQEMEITFQYFKLAFPNYNLDEIMFSLREHC